MRLSHQYLECALPRQLRLRCWYFPGQWLPDQDLARLRETIRTIAYTRLDVLPQYGVFLPSVIPFKNRIITVVSDGQNNRPVGFTAMVHCPVRAAGRDHTIIHLGLVISSTNRLGRELLFQMYFFPLAWFFWLRRLRPFWIASVSMEPTIIGAVADCFGDVYPHYRHATRSSPLKNSIARAFVTRYRDEFGIGPDGSLDIDRFVIRRSCRGPSDALRVSYRHSAKYTESACNTFCHSHLDYDEGDELLQIGCISVRSAISLFTYRCIRYARKRFSR